MMRSMRRVILFAAGLACVSDAAIAQTLRVVAAETALRSRPDERSELVTIVTAGTLLEVTAQQQGWYEVQIAGSQAGSRKGFIAAATVEIVRAAPTGLANSTAMMTAEWQARHDAALRQRQSGIKKVRIGFPIALAGTAVLIYGSYVKGLFAEVGDNEFSTEEYLKWVGGGAALAVPGAVLIARGSGQMRTASRELLILEDERLRAQTSATLNSSWGNDRVRAGVSVGVARTAGFIDVSW
jgi:hypothetical protein